MMALPHLLAFSPQSLFFTLQLLPRPGPLLPHNIVAFVTTTPPIVLGAAGVVIFATTALGAPPFGGIVAFGAAAFDGAKEVFVKAITKLDGVAAALVTAASFSVAATFDVFVLFKEFEVILSI
jgi:hypothetical protein